MMQAEVFKLIERDNHVIGVRAQTPQGVVDIHANLVIGADGRSSTVRSLARMAVDDVGAPIDVLWMRVSKRPEDSATAALGNIRNGHVFVMLDRGDYWQCAFVIRKAAMTSCGRLVLTDFATRSQASFPGWRTA
jgi:2-polyprenyl-6-methoxyphenol hydroxylase-like FAD-dependent oxidoreductase